MDEAVRHACNDFVFLYFEGTDFKGVREEKIPD
jgi:hypothetical protein